MKSKPVFQFFLFFICLLFSAHSFSQNTRNWGTYYGGGDWDEGYCVATDVFGNVYLSGITRSVTAIPFGGFQNFFAGGTYDAFLVKFNSSGNRVWATYYGGAGIDYGHSIATDASGNVYLSGETTSATGISSGGFQNTIGGGQDAFLVKFNSNGNRLWATYYGGTASDNGCAVATDPDGNVYLGGETASPAGIASGGFQNSNAGGTDGYIVKFNSNGNRLWATYFGAGGQDFAHNLTTDSSSNVFLSGNTTSPSGIASGGFQNTNGGSSDAFLAKFDSAGNRMWSTYYGGSSTDDGYGVATDTSGNVFLSGYTPGTTGIASGGFQNTIGGGLDAFLVKFNSAGSRVWATYVGGNGNDFGQSLSADLSGNIYFGGFTTSTSGLAFGGFQNTLIGNSGSTDGFLVKIDGAGNRLCSTYYGGQSDDAGYTVDTDAFGNVYMSGVTKSSSGIASGGFQNAHGGGVNDAFLVKLSMALTATATSISCFGDCNGTATAVPVDTSTYSYSWNTMPIQTTQTATGLCAGSYTVTATDTANTITTATVTVTQPNVLATFINVVNATSCTINNGYATGGVSGGTPAYSYSWNNGQTTQTATGLAPGTYTLTVTDSKGCSVVSTATVTCPTGVESLSPISELIIYPNPTTGIFTVPMPEGEIEIYNVFGVVIYKSEINNLKSEIDLSEQPNGIYFIQLKTEKGIETRKIILNK